SHVDPMNPALWDAVPPVQPKPHLSHVETACLKNGPSEGKCGENVILLAGRRGAKRADGDAYRSSAPRRPGSRPRRQRHRITGPEPRKRRLGASTRLRSAVGAVLGRVVGGDGVLRRLGYFGDDRAVSRRRAVASGGRLAAIVVAVVFRIVL